MKKTLVIQMLIAVAMLLTWGCASAPQFQPAPGPVDGESLVYLYRSCTALMLRSCEVQLDGKKLADLKNGTYVWMHLKPGTYQLQTSWAKGMNVYTPPFSLTVEPGNTYYLGVSATAYVADKSTGISITHSGDAAGAGEAVSDVLPQAVDSVNYKGVLATALLGGSMSTMEGAYTSEIKVVEDGQALPIIQKCKAGKLEQG